MREYEAAVRIDPNHAEAHNNLGAMLHVAGRLDEAAAHYRRALELRPDNVEARSNLGRLLMLQGKTADAAAQFERALAVRPESVSALTGLAWIRATAVDARIRRPGQAVSLADRARQLSRGQDPQAFDALAAAYARAWRIRQGLAGGARRHPGGRRRRSRRCSRRRCASGCNCTNSGQAVHPLGETATRPSSYSWLVVICHQFRRRVRSCRVAAIGSHSRLSPR